MKNRLLLLFLSFIALSNIGLAQTTVPPTFTVKGMFLDSITQEGEPYATIRIVRKSAPDKVVKMAVTNINGKFQEKLAVAPDTYIISVSSIGKTTVVKEFTLKTEEKVLDLGVLHTSEAANELKGVEIVAQKPLVKVDVDKIEYNIEDDPDSKSNSVLEMLRKVPLVTVDGEDNIQVNGSGSFKVHVNGKPNNMMSNNPKEVLKSMPANTIKYIEVITSPGAKYDAEGVGGILNIVTVGGGFEGYTATLRAVAGNTGFGGSGYVTVKQRKLTLSANYSYNYNDQPKSYSDTYRESYKSDTEKYLESTSENKNKNGFQYGNLEASYEIDTLRLLTVSWGLYGGDYDGYNNGNTTMYNAPRTNLAYGYKMRGDNDGSWYSISGGIDYQRSSKKNKNRMLTLSYKLDANPQTTKSSSFYSDIKGTTSVDDIVERLFLMNSRSNGKTNNTEHTFQTDFTTPIGKIHTIETGVKYIYRRNTSDIRFYKANGGDDNYEYDNSRSSNYKHLNHIIAAYAGYTLRYKDFTFKPGVRYEHTVQEVKYVLEPEKNFNVDFDDIVPSVMLGMKLGKTQNIRIGYNMRIYRPGIWYLNPYYDDRTPMFIQQGNSYLDSEKSHSFDLGYSSFSAKFNVNISLNHSFNNNGIESVSRLITQEGGEEINGHLAPKGAIYTTYKNIGKDRSTGLNFYLNWNATPKTRIYVNGRGSYQDIKSPEQNLHNYGWTGSLYGGVQHTLPWKLRLSLNGGGSTPRINLQGKRSGYYYYSINFNRAFLKEDRLSVGVYCSNVFEKYRSYNNTTMGENFLSKNSSRYPSRNFGMHISYRLGELKASVKKTARSISNDDVKAGGNSSGSGGGGGGE